MSSDTSLAPAVLSVEGLGKSYGLGEGRSGYDTLRESISGAAGSLLRRRTASPAEVFWALRDVSFEVNPGEVVGLIGSNGAGKSTLLKILSRITEPCEGSARVRGRLSSLLEVGVGFHPELSGRENIYLSGVIMGMSRREVRRRFDEIVEFAELGRFMDTPVKRYSSGMYVRLAFAVAAHLESDILLVDEVLAVGDAAFQRRCLGKMEDVTRQGRTVLFVSHNLPAVESLTQRCLWLDQGRLKESGETREVVAHYLERACAAEKVDVASWRDRKGVGGARIVKLECLDDQLETPAFFRPGQEIRVQLGVRFDTPLAADVAVVVEGARETPLFSSHLSDHLEIASWEGYREFELKLSPNHLRRGRYLVSLAVFSPERSRFYDVIHHVPAFEIQGVSPKSFSPEDERWGELYFPFPWTVER